MAKTILVLAANPKDTSRLRLDQEIREIENGLQRASKRDEFVLKQVWAVRRRDFRRAMLDLKPNIVHFCGHGSEDGIAFEDDNGSAQFVSAEALSGFFELFADTVECVVLNACYTEVQAEAIAEHVPYVIGMSKSIGDTAAVEFSIAFYDALGAGMSIEFAYKLACNSIQIADLPENSVPVLKSKRDHSEQISRQDILPHTDENSSEKYTMLATSGRPALILLLIDVGYHMQKYIDDIPSIEIVNNALAALLQAMIFQSISGSRILPRYHVGCYTYGSSVRDLYGGILSIDRIASIGMPNLYPTDETGDTFEAFFYIENVLKAEINRYHNCPAPLVCHISAGEYPCKNPESVANRIKGMSVNDGEVLIENILIDTESVLIPTNRTRQWAGIRDENELAKSYARQLFRMSSIIPESYRERLVEAGYNLSPNAKMLYPGTQVEMIELGFVTPVSTRMS